MSSLMHEFAEARRQRTQERTELLENCQQARQERQKDLQTQAEATAEFLAKAEIERLESEKERKELAAVYQDVRQEETLSRSEQVADYVQNIRITRSEQTAEDNAQRLNQVKNRAFETQMQLKDFNENRIQVGESDRVQRQQQVIERAAYTEMQLEDLNKNRLDAAANDAKQRAQEFSDRASNVRASLEQIEANRLAQAKAQAQKLRDYRAKLSDSVWANSRSADSTATTVDNLEPQPIEIISNNFNNGESPINSLPEEGLKPTDKIEKFVNEYVAQLSTNSSLIQVVNDRDIVRDLLAQGANTLKVDPSDILNTLLQMAEVNAAKNIS